MLDTTSTRVCEHGQAPGLCTICRQSTHAELTTHLDGLLAAARPRLLRLARLNGVPLDSADDVVQETLVEAWRHLGNLREPDRFDSWLDGICRNVCRRQARTNSTDPLQQVNLSHPYRDDSNEFEDSSEANIPDSFAPDPAEELSRQDLVVLLDRALGHLPSSAREIVEMCYLAELPQREAAARFGLTIGALELRLHRARRQLREVLSGELRSDAEAFGLVLDEDLSTGWRETREWCWLCSKHRLRGIFERQTDGTIHLRLRCPDCSQRYDMDIINSMGLVALDGLGSFRPAIKRIMQKVPDRFIPTLRAGLCVDCGTPAQVKVMGPGDLPLAAPAIPGRFWLVSDCPNCGINASDIISVLVSYPTVLRFAEQCKRFVTEPPLIVEYGGRPVICSRLTDISSAERLAVLTDPQTLQVLATFME